MVYQGTNRPREDDEQAIASLVSFQPRAGSAKMPQLQMPLPFDHPGEAAPALQETSTYPDSQSDDDDAGEEARASKRRNMMNVDERRQLLESDAWCARVEPKRVLCLGCKRWLKLDQRSLYFSGLWLKHRDKCAAIKRLKGEAVIQKKRRTKGTATKKAVTGRTVKATATRQTRQLAIAKIKSEEPVALAQSGDPDPEATTEMQEAQDMPPTIPDAPSASGSRGGQASPHSQIAAPQVASPPAYGAPASYGHWARIFYPSSRGISPATNTESSLLPYESFVPVAPALHFRYDVDDSRISEVPASVPRRIVNDWPNFGDRILVRDQLQNQIAGGYDATGSYYAQTGLMGPGVPYARPSTINSGRHEPSRALTPYDEDDFLYEAEIYDEEHYYQNGVFAPEIPGECPTTPCHHRYRFSTRHELDAYFDGTIIEAIAVNAPPVDPDVMNGARCLTLLAARIRQRG
ncbi:hypothetical protein D9615_005829 [Tricholomella constricta]|uniref:Uncharacterized protein n=1 Tax=Tricholomella constricta TaxID=117010 RepID=A0A8H5HB74_9AGAR|nr:hypothetical protein D9615_005829 [Tricholomella constricta]